VCDSDSQTHTLRISQHNSLKEPQPSQHSQIDEGMTEAGEENRGREDQQDGILTVKH
jgi:hypothetical protein